MKMTMKCIALLFRHVMHGATVISLITSSFQMNAKTPTPMGKTRMTGDLTPGTNSKSLHRMKLSRRLKMPSKQMMNATGTTAPANSKSAMLTDTSMVTTHAGSNTAGTTVEDMNVKSGTLLAVTNMVNGCGTPMTALKVVLNKSVLQKVSLMILLSHSKLGALTAHATMKVKLNPKKRKNKTGSTTFGAPLKMVPRTRAN